MSVPQVQAAMQQAGLAISQPGFAQAKGPDQAIALIRKAQLVVDSEIARIHLRVRPACVRGCDHCCSKVVLATFPEVLDVADHVRKHFSEDDLRALLGRLDAYRNDVIPYFGTDLHMARPVCPLLVEHECLAYTSRPLMCRATNSMDPGACLQVKLRPGEQVPVPMIQEQSVCVGAVAAGFAEGMKRNGISASRYDLGMALRIVLTRPDAATTFFEDDDVLSSALDRGRTAADREPNPPPPTYPRYAPNQEPTGNIRPTDTFRSMFFEYTKGDLEAAFRELKGAHPIHRMRRMTVPMAYRNMDEVQRWRARFDSEVEAFALSDYDPREAFDALYWIVTYGLAYQLNDVRESLSKFGDLICSGIAARVFPDLTAELPPKWNSGRLKVGYISYNIRNSNGAKWALGWLRNHGDDVETYVFNLFEDEDQVSHHFKASADHYFHLHGNVPQDARFIKSLGLDALIYTDLGMQGRNYQFASLRLAPVQCTAWGHPVTSGMPTIDYYLSSELMESPDADSHYRERLVRLPNSGLCYPRPRAPLSDLTKADFGLDDGPLYLNCQNLMKCGPEWDFLYRRINEETGRPVVFVNFQMRGPNEITQRRMEDAGIKAIWLKGMSNDHFLRLLTLAEVSLDPPGWSGGNSTVQALSLGVPVVTLPTAFMRGRHSLAFLKLAGADGLVATGAENYVDLAINGSRRAQAAAGMNCDNLFDDTSPVVALDDLLRRVCSP